METSSNLEIQTIQPQENVLGAEPPTSIKRWQVSGKREKTFPNHEVAIRLFLGNPAFYEMLNNKVGTELSIDEACTLLQTDFVKRHIDGIASDTCQPQLTVDERFKMLFKAIYDKSQKIPFQYFIGRNSSTMQLLIRNGYVNSYEQLEKICDSNIRDLDGTLIPNNNILSTMLLDLNNVETIIGVEHQGRPRTIHVGNKFAVAIISLMFKLKQNHIRITDEEMTQLIHMCVDVIMNIHNATENEIMTFATEHITLINEMFSRHMYINCDGVRHTVLISIRTIFSTIYGKSSEYIANEERSIGKSRNTVSKSKSVVVVSSSEVSREMTTMNRTPKIRSECELARDVLNDAIRNCWCGPHLKVNGHEKDIRLNIGGIIGKKLNTKGKSPYQLLDLFINDTGKTQLLVVQLLNVLNNLVNDDDVSDEFIIDFIEMFPSRRFKNFLRNFNCPSKWGLPFVSASIWKFRTALVEYLIANDVDMTATNSMGETPVEVFQSLTQRMVDLEKYQSMSELLQPFNASIETKREMESGGFEFVVKKDRNYKQVFKKVAPKVAHRFTKRTVSIDVPVVDDPVDVPIVDAPVDVPIVNVPVDVPTVDKSVDTPVVVPVDHQQSFGFQGVVSPFPPPFGFQGVVPQCRYGMNCTMIDCRYRHPHGWDPIKARNSIPCRYGIGCRYSKCPFQHPEGWDPSDHSKWCRYLGNCRNPNCEHKHPKGWNPSH